MKPCELIFGLLVFGSMMGCVGMAAAEQPILVDDFGYHDLSCQGCFSPPPPRMNGLAASGVRFTSGYVSAPQCGTVLKKKPKTGTSSF